MRLGVRCAVLAVVFAVPFAAMAQAVGDRRMLTLVDGQQETVFGATYTASGATTAVVSLSSELATLAVVSGSLRRDDATARAGQALVTPLDGNRTVRFGYDAARLRASLPPGFASDLAAPLDVLAGRQRRAKFWGLVEPAGINAAAPGPPAVEGVRRSYLGNVTVTTLRQAAQGKPDTLARLTATRFAEALAAGDAGTVADLIDPKPFTDTGAAAGDWQAARQAFAQRLVSDAALKAAMINPPVATSGTPAQFDVGGLFRIQLVARDRAMFVLSVEPVA